MPKYPEITVKLIGENSNAFNILGICIKAMRRAGLTEEQVDEFRMEATSGDYPADIEGEGEPASGKS